MAKATARKTQARKSPRRFMDGGTIDEFGNDLTRSNAMGSAADKMAQDRIASQNTAPAPTQGIGNGLGINPLAATATDPAMTDMNNLGKVYAPGSGLGAGANYGWSTQSASEKAQAAGLDPHAPNPTYRADGRLTPLSQAQQTPAASRNPLTANLMTPVESMFPTRRGIASFADGGAIKETPEQLMARMAAKYGVSASAAINDPETAPAPAPAPVAKPAEVIQQPKGIGGIISVLKGRKAQLDKAIDGYANGGKIKGPGTSTSDSIAATVKPTGEPIKVSTNERILSAMQDTMLEAMARKMGFDNLDAMLEAGTGKPVGPTIKAGQRAAATGLPPDQREPYVTPISNDQYFIAKSAKVSAAGPLDDAAQSHATATGAVKQNPLATFASTTAPDRPSSSSDNPLSRTPTGIAQPIDKPLSEKFAPGVDPDKDRPQSISDGITFGTTTGANGKPQRLISGVETGKTPYVGADGQPTNDWTQTDRYQQAMTVNHRMDNLAEKMKRDRLERNAYDPSIKDERVRGLSRQQLLETDRLAEQQGEVQNRMLDRQIKQTKLAGDTRMSGLQSAYIGESDPLRKEEIGQQIRGLSGRSASDPDRVTLSQARENYEIEAARKAIAGLSPEEIRKRTAKQTNTGRDNADFDPTLERALSLSNRRKIGTRDDWFDQRAQQSDAPAYQGNDGDQVTRFRADPAMQGHRPGKQTTEGTEVFDSSGKLIGYYR